MRKQEAIPALGQLLGLPDNTLSQVDPVVMNLIVARGTPALVDLDIGRYVRLADQWAADLKAHMPALEAEFHRSPDDWRNDVDFFRLGLICWYVDEVLGIAYREDQRNVTRILYTDPGDLFLHGVMDTRRGTCGNLALLHVVLGRRLGLPVSLACVGSHFLCRFDDGQKTINIEATETGRGGFSSQPDEYVLEKHRVPATAQACGSDLRAVTPREMLGLFLGARARHYENTGRMREAEADYLLARSLFPRNRQLYKAQCQVSVQCSMELFEPGEKGHPTALAEWLDEVVCAAPWSRRSQQRTSNLPEDQHASNIGPLFQQIPVGRGSV